MTNNIDVIVRERQNEGRTEYKFFAVVNGEEFFTDFTFYNTLEEGKQLFIKTIRQWK